VAQPQTISRDDPRYPARLRRRLGAHAPSELTALGNLDLLSQPTTALFCSARCPGKLILRTYDQAAQWRDAGHCVVSGFHSPVEKECLLILLRGEPPIIICPARGLPKRIPPEWKKPLADGRLLILSIFPQIESRITAELAARRNELVAALADQVFVAYATPGGRLETSLRQKPLPVCQPANTAAPT
jgi:predicted Rossmann fold nucleotide-binding protein DprA/Smf involved in DNA uptake